MKRVFCFAVFVLLFCLPIFLSAQLPSGVQVPAGKGGVESQIPFTVIEDECEITYTFKLQVFNLDLLNGMDFSYWLKGDPMPPALDIPEIYGPLYLRCVLNDEVDHVMVESLDFTPIGNGQYVFVFEHSMTMDISDNCDEENPTEHSYFVRMSLLFDSTPYTDPVQYPGSEIDPILNYLFPICNFTGTNSLFDCNYLPTSCPISSCVNTNWADWFEIKGYVCWTNCEYTDGPDDNSDDFTGDDSNTDNRNEMHSNDDISSDHEIFPNPFNSEISILWESASEESKIQLFRSNGQLVKSWNNSGHEAGETTNLSTIELPKGVYFLIVQNEGETTHHKLLKM